MVTHLLWEIWWLQTLERDSTVFFHLCITVWFKCTTFLLKRFMIYPRSHSKHVGLRSSMFEKPFPLSVALFQFLKPSWVNTLFLSQPLPARYVRQWKAKAWVIFHGIFKPGSARVPFVLEWTTLFSEHSFWWVRYMWLSWSMGTKIRWRLRNYTRMRGIWKQVWGANMKSLTHVPPQQVMCHYECSWVWPFGGIVAGLRSKYKITNTCTSTTGDVTLCMLLSLATWWHCRLP